MQMERIRFSVIIGAFATNAYFFREAAESAKALKWNNIEIQVLDACPEAGIEALTKQIFRDDYRLRYVKLRPKNSLADVWNEGIRRAKGDYLIFVGLTDRLNTMILKYLSDFISANPDCGIIYTDHDEIKDGSRVNPYFLPDLNKELLIGQNYIGDTFIVKSSAFRRTGGFRKELSFAFAYDFFLRAMAAGVKFGHIAALLWHAMIPDEQDNSELSKLRERSLREHITAVSAYLNQAGIPASVERGLSGNSWVAHYDGSGYEQHRRDVIILREKGVHVITSKAVQTLYSYVSQPDVAIAGGKFISGISVNNAGFIYDREGVTYPACHGIGAFSSGLYGRASTAQDVSMVDFSYCCVDSTFFKRCGGFDQKLRGNDMILDLCLKARAGGLRVVYVPRVVSYRRGINQASDEASRKRLREKWQKTITAGDPYYNRNLPAGMQNYFL